MTSSSRKNVPYYKENLYLPPLSPEHVDKIFADSVQSLDTLPYTVCMYLKQLAYLHYLNLRIMNDCLPYELDPHDLTMYFLGMDAPLSMIIAAAFISDQKYLQIIKNVVLSPDCDDFLFYNGILQNRIHEGIRFINMEDEQSILNVFDHLCERPFYRKEEYFLAGVEASKLLYKKAIEELEKLFDPSPG